MSVTVTTSSHALAMSSAVARDQAESLARSNARPDDGFWRDVFEQAGGQAGMAGAGAGTSDGLLDAHAGTASTFPAPLPLGGPTPASGEVSATEGMPADRHGAMGLDAAAGPQDGVQVLAAIPGEAVVATAPGSQMDVRRVGAGSPQADARSRSGGGAPHALGPQPVPVVITVAAGATDELRVFLRGQGLTPARAMALASQAAAGALADSGGAVVSVALNGRTIYSTGETGRDDASGSTCFSMTA